MACVDLFCVPEDRHRVILLADLLERAGQSLRLRTEPVSVPSDPSLVVCSAAALRHEWLVAILQSDRQVVAIRLDNERLPVRCDEVIDLQSWPARSADAKVGGLVRLLQASLRAPLQGRREVESPDSRSSVGVRSAPLKRPASQSSWAGGLLVGGLVLLTGVVLWALVPDSETGTGSEVTRVLPEPIMRPRDIVPDRGPVVAAGGDTTSPGGSTANSPEDSIPESPTESPAASSRANDSISHLCQASSLQAALAWAGVLDWRQHKRLDDEPCIARLLQRPGFEPLKKALSVS